MLRYGLMLLVLAHGFLHFLRFMNQRSVGSQMSDGSLVLVSAGMSRVVSMLWLLTGFGFFLAMGAYLLQRDWWLTVAVSSVLASQLLIIDYWAGARAGTITNIVIALVLGLMYAHNRFEQQANQEAQRVLDQPASATRIVTHAMLADLPMPVQQWLLASGVVGKERIHTVRLRQRGLMRTSPAGEWMPTEAEQYFNIDAPGFVWKAAVRMLSVVPLAGRDKYENGKGNMLIKVLSLVPVVNASDAKTNQGTLLRFLGEMCWFPSASLSPYITWKAIDATRAQATMTYKGVSATAVFAFTEQHQLTSVTANRYMGGGRDGKLEKWHIPVHAWKRMHGITIPVKGDVIWQLPAGDFNYYQWEITDIDYNKPVLYQK